MPRIVQHRRGTTAEVAGITGAAGELFVDTSKCVVVAMDGITQGGQPMATETSVVQLSSTVVGVIADVTSVSSVANQAAVNVSSVSSTVSTLNTRLNSLSSTVANISVPTGTTTTLGIVRPDNSSINISTNGVLSLGSSITASWTIQQVSNDLVFYFGGTARFRLTSGGAFVAADNVTAYGTV
jgi:hypothetical protein